MIIVAGRFGRLGNRLILFSHFIAFALEQRVRLCNPYFKDYAQHFETTQGDPLCRYPATASRLPKSGLGRKAIEKLTGLAIRLLRGCGRIPGLMQTISIRGSQKCLLDSQEFVRKAKATRLLLVRGWRFRCQEALDRHADEVRQYFRPVLPIRRRVDELIVQARKSCDVLVGVHIRHGDYETAWNGLFFHPVETYVSMMRKAETLFPSQKVGFLICSDETQDASNFVGFRYTFGTGQFIEDLYGLAKCDYLLGTTSTFLMWSSFYGRVPMYAFSNPESDFGLCDFTINDLSTEFFWAQLMICRRNRA